MSVPAAPSVFSLSLLQEGRVRLNYTVGSNATAVRAFYSYSSGGVETPPVEFLASPIFGTTGKIKFYDLHFDFSDESLPNYFYLRAENFDGISAATPRLQILSGDRPTAGATLPQPTGLVASEIRGGSVKLSWVSAGLTLDTLIKITRPGYSDLIEQALELETFINIYRLNPSTAYTATIGVTSRDNPVQWGDSVSFTTLPVEELITGPAEVQTLVNAEVVRTYRFTGIGYPQAWTISDGPPGVTIAAGNDYSLSGTPVFLGGAPTEPGVFDALITVAAIYTGGETTSYSFPTRFVVGGLPAGGNTGRCLPWMHADPLKRDLQFSMRSRAVKSFSDPGLVFKQNEGFQWRVVVLDGAKVSTYVPERIRIVVRALDDLEAPPLLEFEEETPTVSPSSGNERAYLVPALFGSDELERRFDSLNANDVLHTAYLPLACAGELALYADGVWIVSHTFGVTIEQDLKSVLA